MTAELEQGRNGGIGSADARTDRRSVLRVALGAAAATVGAGALLEAGTGSASANTGSPVILGNPNTANAPTQVKWNGGSGYTGVILLANDSTYAGTGANYPAALGGWVGAGATAGTSGVPNGIYGYTEANPTTSITPFGVVGLATQGTGVRGETRSASIFSIGVEGLSPHGIAVSGTSAFGTGVSGTGSASSPGVGVSGKGYTGVSATGASCGVLASGSLFGVSATGSIALTGSSSTNGGMGVQGMATGPGGRGVVGSTSGSSASAGVHGLASAGGDGVLGQSANPSLPGNGVHAVAGGAGVTSGAFGAVFAEGGSLSGVYATSTSATNAAVCASNPSGVGLRVQGRLQVQGNAVGQATLAAGTSAVVVSAAAATAGSTILLTPLGDPGARLWISARAAGSFTISASASVPAAVAIQYLIVN